MISNSIFEALSKNSKNLDISSLSGFLNFNSSNINSNQPLSLFLSLIDSNKNG